MRDLTHAARPLANDLASSLLFAALLAAGVDAQTSTIVAMGFGMAHVVLWRVLKKPVAPLQWASLGLVLVFGGVSLLLHDPRFLMAKPTLIYLLLAAFMLKPGWMLRYLPPVAKGHGERMMVGYGYAWAGLMALSGVLNLVVAIRFPEHWPLYKVVFPMSSKLLLFAIQFTHIRAVVKPKVMAQMQGQKA